MENRKEERALRLLLFKEIEKLGSNSKRRYNYFIKIKYSKQVAFALLTVLLFTGFIGPKDKSQSFFATRGVVLTTADLETVDWPKKAKDAGLTTIATHITPSQVVAFIQSPKGQDFLRECKEFGLEVEHELHAMNDLLPRELFKEDPSMFRMNKEGKRVADFNLCVHSEKALETVCENAVRFAKILKPTTGRYFFWIDDGRPMCHCSQCIQYSDSEQALILENRMLKALRAIDPRATLAHLAYLNTMTPPAKVKPEPGVFLEFAPIQRSWDNPLRNGNVKSERLDNVPPITHGRILELLDENLKVFGRENAQVLEYWLDVSLFSNWQKPAKKLPWNKEVFLNDIDVYAQRGIKNITTFAVYIDDEYLKNYQDVSFVNEYGAGLKSYKLND
jgi:hypothetical protein